MKKTIVFIFLFFKNSTFNLIGRIKENEKEQRKTEFLIMDIVEKIEEQNSLRDVSQIFIYEFFRI